MVETNVLATYSLNHQCFLDSSFLSLEESIDEESDRDKGYSFHLSSRSIRLYLLLALFPYFALTFCALEGKIKEKRHQQDRERMDARARKIWKEYAPER